MSDIGVDCWLTNYEPASAWLAHDLRGTRGRPEKHCHQCHSSYSGFGDVCGQCRKDELPDIDEEATEKKDTKEEPKDGADAPKKGG